VVGDAQERRRIYIVDRNGDRLRAVTPPGDAGNVVWSPDGRHLAFDASPEGKDDSSTGGWELWTIRADGSARRRLTRDHLNDWGPSWSPDGRELSFSRGRNDQYEVYRLDIAGARLRRVTENVFR
jgi:TolB protein